MTRGASRDQSIERDEAPCGNIPVAVRRVEWRPAGVGSRVAGVGASGSFAVRLRSALSHDSGQGRRACLLYTSSTSESDCHSEPSRSLEQFAAAANAHTHVDNC